MYASSPLDASRPTRSNINIGIPVSCHLQIQRGIYGSPPSPGSPRCPPWFQSPARTLATNSSRWTSLRTGSAIAARFVAPGNWVLILPNSRYDVMKQRHTSSDNDGPSGSIIGSWIRSPQHVYCGKPASNDSRADGDGTKLGASRFVPAGAPRWPTSDRMWCEVGGLGPHRSSRIPQQLLEKEV